MYGRAIELVSAVRFKARVFVASEKFSTHTQTHTHHNHPVALKCSNFSHVNKTSYNNKIEYAPTLLSPLKLYR